MRFGIGVCTCGRPELAKTLASISSLAISEDWHLTVYVADNGSPSSAKSIVEAAARSEPRIAYQYLISEPFNISGARNAILDASANEEWLAFIDDDEIATPRWLGALYDMARETKATAVFGPVSAIYPPEAPSWVKDGDFHSTTVTFVRGEIITGYSCNVLMRRADPSLERLQFDLSLGRTGGEDTLYFATAYKRGARFAFAPEALVLEPVAPSRMSLGWLAQRRFRSGQTHGRLLLREGLKARLVAPFLTSAKAAFCLAMTAAFSPSSVHRHRWLLRAALHLGACSRLFGVSELTLYNAKPPETIGGTPSR